MPDWTFPAPGAAALEILGGTLTVLRRDGRLSSTWTSPQLGDVLSTNLAHIGRFAIAPHALAGITPAVGQQMLKAKWLGPHRPWIETDATRAFELALHGRATVAEAGGLSVEAPGAACWVAPVAIRVHLEHCHRSYFASVAGEAPPGLVVAEEDVI